MYLGMLSFHFIITFFVSLVYRKRKLDKTGKVVYFLLIITYAVLVAVRPDNVIPDVESYRLRYTNGPMILSIDSFINISYLSKVPYYSMGIGASLLAYISASIGVSFEIYSFIIACFEMVIFCNIVNSLLRLFSVEVNKLIILMFSMVIFGYYYMFIAYAQGIAMVLLLEAFYCFLRKKYISCAGVFILSLSFHFVGVCLIPIILIYLLAPKLRDVTYKFGWGIAFALLLTGFGFYISDKVSSLIGNVIGYAVKYNSLYNQYDVIETARHISIVNVVICAFIGVMIYVYNQHEEYWRMMNILFVAMFMMAIFPSWALIHRIYDVFFIFLVPVACMFIKNIGGCKIRIRGVETLVAFSFIFLKFMSMMSIFRAFSA